LNTPLTIKINEFSKLLISSIFNLQSDQFELSNESMLDDFITYEEESIERNKFGQELIPIQEVPLDDCE